MRAQLGVGEKGVPPQIKSVIFVAEAAGEWLQGGQADSV